MARLPGRPAIAAPALAALEDGDADSQMEEEVMDDDIQKDDEEFVIDDDLWDAIIAEVPQPWPPAEEPVCTRSSSPPCLESARGWRQ